MGVGEAMFGDNGFDWATLLGEGVFGGGGGGVEASSRCAGLSCRLVASDGESSLEDRRAGQGDELSGRSCSPPFGAAPRLMLRS